MIVWHKCDVEAIGVELNEEGKSPPRFPVCEKWNKCIALCLGTGLDVACDGFVRATDSNLLVTLQEPGDVVEKAGISLREELLHLGECPTGDVRVTSSFELHFCRHIIHAVPPIYSSNFHTASLSSLHSVYKNVLNSAIEQRLRTLVISPMFIVPGSFPFEDGCHLVLRTFRRYFDHFGPDPFVEMIVLSCPNDSIYQLYQTILPVYFPRNASEQQLSLNCVEDDGLGGPLLKDRNMSIKVLVPTDGDDNDLDLISETMGSASVFGSVKAPPSDVRRVQRIRNRAKISLFSSSASKSNKNSDRTDPGLPSPLVELSLRADLTSLVASGFLYIAGTDKFGRHVVVMVAKELDLRKFDMNHVLFYFVRVLEPIVTHSSNKYVFIYCHSMAGRRAMTGEQAGGLVKALFDSDQRYLAQLQTLYVLHADWRTKIALTYARVAHLPDELNDRVETVHCCQSFVSLLLPITPRPGSLTSNGMDALLPQFVIDFDHTDHTDHQPS